MRVFVKNPAQRQQNYIGSIYYKKGNAVTAVKLIKDAISIDRELIDAYSSSKDGYPHGKIGKLEFLFNKGINILIDYYSRKGDDTMENVYKNIKKVMNGKIDKTKVK